jgi:hypothetical protein
MSDTPRTDAAVDNMVGGDRKMDWKLLNADDWRFMIDHAKKLERELNKAQAPQPEGLPKITPELWCKLQLAFGAAREYPDFDSGSPIRDLLDDALADLERIAPESVMRCAMNEGSSK